MVTARKARASHKIAKDIVNIGMAGKAQGADTDLSDAIKKSPIWQAKSDLLNSIPGVGKVTVNTLLLPELGN